jgi:predicted dehydrogenase
MSVPANAGSGDRPTRIALWSFAHPHALAYARLLSRDSSVELVAADPDGPPGQGLRGTEAAAHLGVRYLEDYRRTLDWGPDAVVLCAENARHRPLVELAAAAGASVLCEKPLATTVADAEAMVAACEAAGVALMTAYPVRFSPAFAALRATVSSGALGRLLGVRGTNNGKLPTGRAWFTDPALSGGGALVDHVVHCADLLDVLLDGAEPESVYAVTNRILSGDRAGVETGGLVTMRYPTGVVATIDCSWSQPEDAPIWGGLTLQVVGSEGQVDIDPFGQRISGHLTGRGTAWLPYGSDLDAAMLAEFLSALRSGRPPQPDGTVGVRTLRIVAAAQQSADAGHAVAPGGAALPVSA